MIEDLPSYISITFLSTTFLTVGFLLAAIRQSVLNRIATKVFVAVLAFWMVFEATLALAGFHRVTGAFPPRVFAFAAMPAIGFILVYLIFFRKQFVEQLPLKLLTLLHIVRIPVEIVLLWLFQQGQVPVEMTFEGGNFDILSGITAPIIYFLAFRNGNVNRPLLIVWNIVALLLLINIVTTAILAFPSPFQQIAFDQPNLAVTYFPFIWLPAVIVPIVFFSHLAALVKLITGKDK